MIKVFEATEKLFNNNGLKILKPYKALITKKDNDQYFLEIEDSIEFLEYYQEGNIIRVNTPWRRARFSLLQSAKEK